MPEATTPIPKEIRAFPLEPTSILPPVCPDCGAVGVVPWTLPNSLSQGSWTLHYCELCHEAGRKRDTLLFSLGMATSIGLAAIMGISIANLREQWVCWWPVWTVCALASAGLGTWLARRRAQRLPSLGRSPTGSLLLIVPSERGRRAMQSALGTLSSEIPARAAPSPRGALWLIFAPPMAMALPVLVTYLSLRARLVIVDPEDDALFITDSRIVSDLPAFRHEWPSGGLTLHLIGGTRHLEIVRADGSTLLAQDVWLEPGGTYLFGNLPLGHCLFREEQQYGESSLHSLAPIPGGPLYKLTDDIQLYFEPPPAPESSKSRGGSLVALRVLPCDRRSKLIH